MAAMSPEARAFYNPRIKNVEVLLIGLFLGPLWGAQVIFDIFVITSPIASIVGITATLLLNFFFFMKDVYGVKKNFGKKLGANLVTAGVEIIPEVDLIPGDIIDLFVILFITRQEDRQTAETKAVAAAKAEQEQQARLYQYNVYMQQQAEQEEEIEVANDNAIQAANDNALAAEEEAGEEDFEYQQAA